MDGSLRLEGLGWCHRVVVLTVVDMVDMRFAFGDLISLAAMLLGFG